MKKTNKSKNKSRKHLYNIHSNHNHKEIRLMIKEYSFQSVKNHFVGYKNL
jgi:hypothetical protein